VDKANHLKKHGKENAGLKKRMSRLEAKDPKALASRYEKRQLGGFSASYLKTGKGKNEF